MFTYLPNWLAKQARRLSRACLGERFFGRRHFETEEEKHARNDALEDTMKREGFW